MLTNKGNTVLYTGVTDDVQRRLFEHRTGSIKTSFTWRYQCWKLVFMEEFGDLAEAIEREKQLKNWKREWKDAIVARENPLWKDLSLEWDYAGWYDPNDPPEGFYQQHLVENWGGPSRDAGSPRA